MIVFSVVFAVTSGFSAPAGSNGVTVRDTTPTASNDISQGFLPGYLWVDQAGNSLFMATDTSDGTATWVDISAGGGSVDIEEEDAVEQSNATSIDFGAQFALTCAAGECDIAIDSIDISDVTNLSATGGVVLTGDQLSAALGTAIDSLEITDGEILEADLSAIDAAADGECLTYDNASGGFEWVTCASGDTVDVSEETVSEQVNASELDFGAQFNVSCAAGVCTITVDSITTSQIVDGTILPADLNDGADTPGDEDCLTYEATGPAFEWQTCGGAADTVDIELGGVSQQTDAATINFSTEFGVSCATGDCDITIDAVDISDDTNLSAASGIILTGDQLTAALGTAIDASEITNSTILEVDLSAIDAAADGECLTYDSSSGGFEWVACGGAADAIDIEEDGVSEQADASTLDFGGQFNVSCVAGVCDVTVDHLGFVIAEDSIIMGNGSDSVVTAIPDCDDASGNHLNYDTATDAWSCGTSSSVTDTDTHINIEDGNASAATDIDVLDFGDHLDVQCAGSECDVTVSSGFAAKSVTITIEDPTNAEDITLMFTDRAITIVSETCVVVGSTPSVTVTLRHGTDRSAAGTELNTGGNAITSTTSGDQDTTLDDATIVADSWLWIETTAQSGTVDTLTCTWEYTVDA